MLVSLQTVTPFDLAGTLPLVVIAPSSIRALRRPTSGKRELIMFRTTSFAAILLGGALAALPAFSQEGGRSDATVQAFGSFVKTTTDNGVQQGATNSGGVLASCASSALAP